MSIIKLSNVSKFYNNNNVISMGFNKVNLELSMGEFVVITGESGSGKSTLLNVISGLDSYQDGEMYINGEETSHYSEEDLEVYRRKYIGNIFQSFNLINSYTVFQNVELVLLMAGLKKSEVRDRVLDVIDKVGLTKYKNTKTSKLSGGQKQRVAIARSLVKDTPIIVADEPTGNLDRANAKSIMELLYSLSREKLVVVVTHNYEDVEAFATRKIVMSDGKIIEDKKIKKTKEYDNKGSEYKNIRFVNEFILAFRNTFNIIPKFILLLLVYLFLTISVFGGYSSLRKSDKENTFEGSNPMFSTGFLSESNEKKRIVINKKDRSLISLDDINKVSKLKHISKIYHDDALINSDVNIEGRDKDSNFFYGKLRNIREIKKAQNGVLPIAWNQVYLVLGKWDTPPVLNKDATLTTDNENMTIQIVGYEQNSNSKNGFNVSVDREYLNSTTTYIYATDELINRYRLSVAKRSFKTEMYLNYGIYNMERLPINLVPSDRVGQGYAMFSSLYDTSCEKGNCMNHYISLHTKSLYANDSVDLIVNNKFDQDDFVKKTGFRKEEYEFHNYTIFINPADYNKLYDKGIFQSSIYVDNYSNVDYLVSELDKLGYNSYPVVKMLVNPLEVMNAIMRVLRVLLFGFSIFTLFLLSYFIIRIILKSRNIYYSTIRILGATKKICRNLLNIELLIDANIAYFSIVTLSYLASKNIIHIEYFSNLIKYFGFADFVILYIVLSLMSLLITSRYARKIFKYSPLETYREEI